MIDYASGAVMVDAVSTEDWEGTRSLKPRRYYDMYYSHDGIILENIPIRSANWPADLKNRYNEIRSLLRQSKEPLLPFDTQFKGMQPGSGQRGPGGERQDNIMLFR
jgi:hypothetical protein